MEKHCKRPSHAQLNAYFHKNIRKNRIPVYMERYLEICNKKLRREQLASLKTDRDFWHIPVYMEIFNKKFREQLESLQTNKVFWSYVDWLINTLSITEKDFVVPRNPKLEKILNIISYASSYAFSWSQYLLLFESGRKILRDLFGKPSLTSFMNLYAVIYTIQITQTYDDIFTKDMMRLIPVILPSEILQKAGILQGDITFLNESWVWTRVQSAAAKIILIKLATYLEQIIVDSGYWDSFMQKIKGIKRIIKNEYDD